MKHIDFLNPEYYDVNGIHPDAPNKPLLRELFARMNDQNERLWMFFTELAEDPEHKKFGYAEIMHWKARANYHRSQGNARKAARLEKRMALEEAKSADHDEKFMDGYKEFLASEFDLPQS